jgi:hypothetical protein
MSKTEIMEKYRAEFLLWYADYELEDSWNGHSHVLKNVDDLFWYWLSHEKDVESNVHTFLKGLL